jgi:hypothetical protein
MRDICSGWTPKSDSCVEMDFLGPEHCGRVSIILFAHGLKSALSWEKDQRTYNKIETHHKVTHAADSKIPHNMFAGTRMEDMERPIVQPKSLALHVSM